MCAWLHHTQTNTVTFMVAFVIIIWRSQKANFNFLLIFVYVVAEVIFQGKLSCCTVYKHQWHVTEYNISVPCEVAKTNYIEMNKMLESIAHHIMCSFIWIYNCCLFMINWITYPSVECTLCSLLSISWKIKSSYLIEFAGFKTKRQN